jgi:hypothetical protein
MRIVASMIMTPVCDITNLCFTRNVWGLSRRWSKDRLYHPKYTAIKKFVSEQQKVGDVVLVRHINNLGF